MTEPAPTGSPSLTSSADFATVVITRVVKVGREHEFRNWLLRLIAESESFPNNGGTVVLSPAPGESNVFRIVQRFSDSESMRAWEDSDVRRRLSAEANAFSTSQRQMVTGMEAWFQLSDAAGAPPPKKWKMALMTFGVVYVITAVLIPREQAWLPKSWSFYEVNVITNVIIAVLMTYALMPVAARLFRRWLD